MSLFDIFRRRNETETMDEDAFRVEDRGDEKILGHGSITYSKIKKGSIYTGEYWDYFIPAAHVYSKPRVLLVGLGGGTIAFQLNSLLKERVEMDAVEISRRVVELSKKFIPNIDVNVIIGDGAAYIKTTNKRYDLIIVDAYKANKIPNQFFEMQFVRDANRALTQEGILSMNYAMGFMGFLKFNEFIPKLKNKFSVYKVHAALTEENVIILASKRFEKEAILEKIRKNMERTQENSFLFRNYENMTLL